MTGKAVTLSPMACSWRLDIAPRSTIRGDSGREPIGRTATTPRQWKRGEHFRQCLLYLDLNMVRAGVVTRPEQWPDCGYVEIQYPKARRWIMDEEQLMGLTGASSRAGLQQLCRQQVEAALEQ